MALMNILYWMMEDDDDDEDDEMDEFDSDTEEGTLRISVNIEDWKRLADPAFHEHIRMNRATFELLLIAVGNHLTRKGRICRRSRCGLDVALMMTLWVLASPDPFRSVAVKFGVKKGLVHFHYVYIIEALREMMPSYVQWPSPLEKEVIAARFEDSYGYPSVIGCIDGCLIQITAPLEQPGAYIDWHRNYSIQVQAVCDDTLLFRDVYIGEPGSVGDKRCFKRSPLGRKILRPHVMSDKHMLGDGGYTLTSKLMIPFRDDGNLTRRMRTHNYYLSRCRSSIERAFALLKGKWRRLKLFPSYCVEYAVDHITACVVLHNFILLEGASYEVEDDNEPFVVYDRQILEQAKADGALKRDYIADMLCPDE